MVRFSTNYLEPFFLGLFEAQGKLYFRKLATSKAPFLRIKLPPTKENKAMLELLNTRLALHGFVHITKSTKGNPSKVIWQSTQRSIHSLSGIFEQYPPLTSETKNIYANLFPRSSKKQNPGWNLEPLVYPKYFGAWVSGFLETYSTFIFDNTLRLEFDQQIDIAFVDIIKMYFQSGPDDAKNLKTLKFSNRFCLEHKQELYHMIAHFNQNPMLGDGKAAYNRFLKKFNKTVSKDAFLKRECQHPERDYLEPFFVGLFEGDGYIYLGKTDNRYVQAFSIELKDLPKNVYMLSLIKNYVGGRLHFHTKTNKRKDGTSFTVDVVRWYVKNKQAICACLEIFSKYPFLTSNKICQLKYFKQSVPSACMYQARASDQKQIIEQYTKSFIIPRYFGPWLSGFIESEGCFHFENDKGLGFSIDQNNDYYILNAIKTYYKSPNKITESKYPESKRGPSISYKFQTRSSINLKNVIMHIDSCPLLGNKQHAYELFRTRYNVKNGILT